MQTIFLPIIFGVLGGLVRSLVGILKYLEKNRTSDNPKNIRWGYFGFSLFVGGILGGLCGAFIINDSKVALLVGYAGTDFLEGLFKLKQKEISQKISQKRI